MEIYEVMESNVRYYCRHFPVNWETAENAIMKSDDGKEYIDFFAGAGSVNYGHNNIYIKEAILKYIQKNGIIQGLDMHTTAKKEFLKTFNQLILEPLQMQFKVQFCAPTGADAVEAAVRLAQKVKKRSGIFAFMGSFHGMTSGAMSLSGQRKNKLKYSGSLNNVVFIPGAKEEEDSISDIHYIQHALTNDRSGIDKPAAIIIESIQAESGVYPFSARMLRDIREICDNEDILLICDEIQTGCYRTGDFFAFQEAGIQPDIVLLSKSIGGFGLPLSMVLIKPQYDLWDPGEYTGTFRGNQLGFVGAKAALEYAQQQDLAGIVRDHEKWLNEFFEQLRESIEYLDVRGRGVMFGIDMNLLGRESLGMKVSQECFKRGLIIEPIGHKKNVLKLMPPLTIEHDILVKGCDILRKVISETI